MMARTAPHPWFLLLLVLGACAACGEPAEPAADVVLDWGSWQDGKCLLDPAEGAPPGTEALGCWADFELLASRPLDASIPGARSIKTVVDMLDDDALHFLNAELYPMHWGFCFDHLSGNGLPGVPMMNQFNLTEYYSPERRFLLGAITWYEGPNVWAYEIGPYDTASADFIARAYDRIRDEVFFGEVLYFHPTSEQVEKAATGLPERIPQVTTDDLYRDTTFLPLNPGTAIGRLRFFTAWDLESGAAFLTPQDIAVIDLIPNDIPVVAGVITAELQTPLSHVNVLSQNRGTPNMSLVGAHKDEALRALDGKWVRLVVDPFEYSVEEVSAKEAEAWWESHKPPAVKIPPMDLSVTELRNVEELTLEEIPAFGGKASHYGMLYKIGDPLRVPRGFAIPLSFYKQFEEDNGFDILIETLLADEQFQQDIYYREYALRQLRETMRKGWVDPTLLHQVTIKAEQMLPKLRLRFRSSTNAEDLDGFTGAGLYTSKSAEIGDPNAPIEDALRKVWASLWNFRAFEERAFRGIDQRGVGMAMLVHRSFPFDDANGVALTNNIFDPNQPAFYVNVQQGEVSVVKPPLGVVPDQFVYYYSLPNQPITYLGHSPLVPDGETVLTRKEVYELGVALKAIHDEFAKVYAKPGNFYAMDVEFKFETGTVIEESCLSPCGEEATECDEEPVCTTGPVTKKLLWVKQARPHYGWSTNNAEE